MDAKEVLLRQILTAEVLILAGRLKALKEKGGGWSSKDYVHEAIELIKQKRDVILSQM